MKFGNQLSWLTVTGRQIMFGFMSFFRQDEVEMDFGDSLKLKIWGQPRHENNDMRDRCENNLAQKQVRNSFWAVRIVRETTGVRYSPFFAVWMETRNQLCDDIKTTIGEKL